LRSKEEGKLAETPRCVNERDNAVTEKSTGGRIDPLLREALK
jgi:hypothetical protein